MALDVTLVSPYIPPNADAGGVASGKALFIGRDSSNGRFAVVDPAGSIRAYAFTPPAGGGIVGTGGISDGASVWAAFGGSTVADGLWMGEFSADGSVNLFPSVFTMRDPRVVEVGDDIWAFARTGAYSTRVFDRAAGTWGTAIGFQRVGADPAYIGGYVWAWGATGGLTRYDPSALTVTSITITGLTVPNPSAQVAYAYGRAWWTTGTAGRLVSIDSSGTVSNTDTDVVFGPSLCLDPQGFLRSMNGTGTALVGWHPSTGATWSESTGASGASSSNLIFTVGSKTISSVR